MSEAYGKCPATGKIQFPTQAVARDFARRYAKAASDRRPRPYMCEVCKCWHTSSHGDKVSRRIARNKSSKRGRR